jgi:hypothetical protein
MATTAAPDGVVLDVVRGADGSPSQERLVRIAAMLRDAELAVPVTTRRRENGRPVTKGRPGRRELYRRSRA